MVFIPFRHGSILVHMLDYISPADTRVVSTKADLAFLRTVRNNAHLCAPKIVIEEILKPHSRNEQEVPAVCAAHGNVVFSAITGNLTVVLAGQSERLIKLLEKLIQIELRRRIVRSVVF